MEFNKLKKCILEVSDLYHREERLKDKIFMLSSCDMSGAEDYFEDILYECYTKKELINFVNDYFGQSRYAKVVNEIINGNEYAILKMNPPKKSIIHSDVLEYDPDAYKDVLKWWMKFLVSKLPVPKQQIELIQLKNKIKDCAYEYFDDEERNNEEINVEQPIFFTELDECNTEKEIIELMKSWRISTKYYKHVFK